MNEATILAELGGGPLAVLIVILVAACLALFRENKRLNALAFDSLKESTAAMIALKMTIDHFVGAKK